jgi:flagellar basal-body rod protein FlgB
MIEPLTGSMNYQLAGRLLDATVLRHQAIASNIANVETAGYTRLDIAPDFAQSLRAEFSGQNRPSSAALSAVRLQLREASGSGTVRADQNNVDLESELMAMSKNHVDFEFLSDLVGRHIKGLKMAMTGRVL